MQKVEGSSPFSRFWLEVEGERGSVRASPGPAQAQSRPTTVG
jgi:hypothetical protein